MPGGGCNRHAANKGKFAASQESDLLKDRTPFLGSTAGTENARAFPLSNFQGPLQCTRNKRAAENSWKRPSPPNKVKTFFTPNLILAKC